MHYGSAFSRHFVKTHPSQSSRAATRMQPVIWQNGRGRGCRHQQGREHKRDLERRWLQSRVLNRVSAVRDLISLVLARRDGFFAAAATRQFVAPTSCDCLPPRRVSLSGTPEPLAHLNHLSSCLHPVSLSSSQATALWMKKINPSLTGLPRGTVERKHAFLPKGRN